MVKYYFENKEKQIELKKILDEWLNTPFRHKCGVKGLGCDCIHFVGKVLEEMGIMQWRNDMVPDYPKDWHLHNTREALQEAICKYLNVEKISLTGILMNGDIILSHYGQASSHTGIYFNGNVYQALNNIGVKSIRFTDGKFRKNMKFAYRLLK